MIREIESTERGSVSQFVVVGVWYCSSSLLEDRVQLGVGGKNVALPPIITVSKSGTIINSFQHFLNLNLPKHKISKENCHQRKIYSRVSLGDKSMYKKKSKSKLDLNKPEIRIKESQTERGSTVCIFLL